MAREYSALQPGAVGDRAPTRSQPKAPSSFYDKWFEDGWAYEILAALLGSALTLALCIIVKKYDGQPVPAFGSVLSRTVTLNFVVSLLLAVAVPALMYPVAQCVSQLKWIWFSSASNGRRLKDLDTFDGGSRGILGGAGFIWKMRARPFASVGALLAIVQLIVSPLAQNAILYRSWGVSIPNSQGATVQAAQNFSEITGQALYSTSPNMQSAIQRGIFSGESVIDPIRPLCSSGNCTWAPYQSLAVCASSANITLKLKNSKNGYTLPGGPYLKPGPTDVILNFSSVGIQESTEDGSDFLNFNRSSAYKNVSSPIADVFFVYQPKPQPLSGTGQGGTVVEPPDPDPNAIEFVLQWCVQTFTTTVLNGIPDTQKTTTFLNFTHTAEEMDPITGELKNSSFAVYVTAHPNPDDPNDVFTIEPSTHANLQNYFQQLFQGNVSMPGGADVHSSSSVAQILFQSFDPPDAGNKTAMDPTVQLGGLNFILDNIAVSMTNYIRANAQNDLVLGTLLLQGQTTVRVQWGYLVAPIVFMILCLLFFATTIVYQRSRSVRVKNWKSSSLAVLHALGPEIHRELGGMSKASVLKEEAERTAVKLVRQEGSEGWRLRDAEEREGKGEAGAGDRYL